MRVIDFHTHTFPDGVASKAIPALAAEVGVEPCWDGTVTGLLAAMDRAGVDASVTQPVATRPEQVRSINDWASSVAGERIIPFGAMHPDLADPAVEIERMAAHGIRGFKMHPEYQSFEPDDPRMAGVYEAASSHGMVLLFHAGVDLSLPTLRGTPAAFSRMLDAWPRLRVVLAHMGGYQLWHEVEEHLVGREVCLDTSYTLGHLPDDEFVALVRAHGADRVLFGSDGPWADAGAELEHLTRLPLDDRELAAILGANAERLLAE